MLHMTDDRAPNFSGEYPSAGELIGPAWRAAWNALRHGYWLLSTDLVQIMCDASPIVGKTALNLLSAARRAGVLEVRHAGHGRPAHYRRSVAR